MATMYCTRAMFVSRFSLARTRFAEPPTLCAASASASALVFACAFAIALCGALSVPRSAFAYGPSGHLIVGRAAEPLLCGAAVRAVRGMTGNEPVAALGLWADRVRGDNEWGHSSPWHYINIPDGGNPRHPPESPEGDVLRSIEQFLSVLRAPNVAMEERRNALRFLVHFIADIHQPLHVGRAEDRGGNSIDVFFNGKQTNLHAFWDSDAIQLSGWSVRTYAARIAEQVRRTARLDKGSNVRDWTAHVFGLREQVYAFDQRTGLLDAAYLNRAVSISQRQLVLAAARLANTLNQVFC